MPEMPEMPETPESGNSGFRAGGRRCRRSRKSRKVEFAEMRRRAGAGLLRCSDSLRSSSGAERRCRNARNAGFRQTRKFRRARFSDSCAAVRRGWKCDDGDDGDDGSSRPSENTHGFYVQWHFSRVGMETSSGSSGSSGSLRPWRPFCKSLRAGIYEFAAGGGFPRRPACSVHALMEGARTSRTSRTGCRAGAGGRKAPARPPRRQGARAHCAETYRKLTEARFLVRFLALSR